MLWYSYLENETVKMVNKKIDNVRARLIEDKEKEEEELQDENKSCKLYLLVFLLESDLDCL